MSTTKRETPKPDADKPYERPTVTRFGTFAELTMQVYKCKA